MKLTVGIPTFNRAHLLRRAIESVLSQDVAVELIVIDDGSTDETDSVAGSYFHQLRYLRQERKLGPNAARNRVLLEASNPWVFYLDDDDQLAPGALSSMFAAVTGLSSATSYPVYFFRASNSWLPCPFLMVDTATLMSGVARGDLVPLIRKDRFLQMGLRYPEIPVGGEGMLSLRVTEQCGIPAWSICVTQVGTDAANRFTSAKHQLKRARQYAELQDRYVSEFSGMARRYAPSAEYKRQLGSAVYWLLAGERGKARDRLRRRWPLAHWIYVAGVYALSWLPLRIVGVAFRAYRKSGASKRDASELNAARLGDQHTELVR